MTLLPGGFSPKPPSWLGVARLVRRGLRGIAVGVLGHRRIFRCCPRLFGHLSGLRCRSRRWLGFPLFSCFLHRHWNSFRREFGPTPCFGVKRRAAPVGNPWPSIHGVREDGVDGDRAAVKLRPRTVYFNDRAVPKLLGGEVEKAPSSPWLTMKTRYSCARRLDLSV